MKKNILLLAILASSALLNAQQTNIEKTTAVSSDKLNIVKTNLLAYSLRSINLSYERVFNKWFSVSVAYNTMPNGNVPYIKSFTDDKNLANMKAGIGAFTIEPRFYVGKGFGHGFYLAPYYRNTSFKTDSFNYIFSQNVNGVNTDIPINISGNANGNSAGLLLGVQWFLGKTNNWVLDWSIVGAHYGIGKGDFRGNSSRPLTADEQVALKKELDGLDIPMVKYTTTVDANGATMKLDGPWAGLRTGLSIGYRF